MKLSDRFPLCPTYGTTSTSMYSTTVIEAYSGVKERNSNWEYPLQRYTVSLANRTQEEHDQMVELFNAAAGSAHLFPYRDIRDNKSCAFNEAPSNDDQSIGTAMAGQTEFQLIKNYSFGGRTQSRKIRRPISGTVLIAVDAIAQAETTDYTIDYDTGIVTFIVALIGGEVVTAGYEYAVWVAFANDDYSISVNNHTGEQYIENSSITLEEDRS